MLKTYDGARGSAVGRPDDATLVDAYVVVTDPEVRAGIRPGQSPHCGIKVAGGEGEREETIGRPTLQPDCRTGLVLGEAASVPGRKASTEVESGVEVQVGEPGEE